MNWAIVALVLQAVGFVLGAIYALWMKGVVKDITALQITVTELIKDVGNVQGQLERINGHKGGH